MSNWKEVYPGSSTVAVSTIAPLPNIVDVVDLRREFDNLILGYQGETPISRPFILRRMRRDSSDNLVPCSCVSTLTDEPDRDFPCPYCGGNGNLWDEELIRAYKVVAAAPGGSNAASNFPKTEAGSFYVPAARFFVSYSINPKKDDRIIEIELDADGNAIVPYNRVFVFEFMLVKAMRGDNGKIEFWSCSGQTMGPATQGLVS